MDDATTGNRDPQDMAEYVIERIRRALAEDRRTGVLDVDVSLAGTKVLLTGTAGTAERLAAISEVVGEVVPDLEVHNQMSVEALALETDSAASRIEPEHLA